MEQRTVVCGQKLVSALAASSCPVRNYAHESPVHKERKVTPDSRALEADLALAARLACPPWADNFT